MRIKYFHERTGWRAELWRDGESLPVMSVSGAESKQAAREAIMAHLERDSAT